jgi:hypothetical protein
LVSIRQLVRWVAAGTFGLSLLSLSACASRTLPLPPPDVDPLPAVSALGLVHVTGTAQAGASVGVMNDSTQRGVITTSSDGDCDSACPFEADVEARPNDSIRVWQFFDTPSGRNQRVPSK